MSNSAAEIVRSHHNCAAVELAHGKHSGLLIHYLSAWKIVHHSLDSFVLLNIAFCGAVLEQLFRCQYLDIDSLLLVINKS